MALLLLADCIHPAGRVSAALERPGPFLDSVSEACVCKIRLLELGIVSFVSSYPIEHQG